MYGPGHPLPEGALVILKSGGPIMTTEKHRDHIIPVCWFSADGVCHRDAFHIDALVVIGMPCKPRDDKDLMEIAKEAQEARRQLYGVDDDAPSK